MLEKLQFSTFLLSKIQLFRLQMFDLCYNTPELFLFFSLIFLSMQYSLLVAKTPITSEITFHYCQKIINYLWITLFLVLINPIPWLSIKFLHSGFLFSSPQVTGLKVIVLLISLFILKSNLFYIYIERILGGDFFLFIGYFIIAILLFLQINDFFILFLMFELISIFLYILIAYNKKQIILTHKNRHYLTKYSFLLYKLNITSKLTNLNIKASFTYFLLNILITAFFLFSLSLLFLLFNTTNFFFLYHLLNNFVILPKLFNLICLSLVFVFFFKLAIVPGHWWISAVFEGCSLLTLMFLAIPLKLVFFYLFIKLLFIFFNFYMIKLSLILVIAALLSMLVGSLALLTQLKIKKFWAYSTINHMGYLMLALSSHTFLGLRAFFLYFIAYLLMNLSFFLILVSCINEHLLKRIEFLNQLVILGFWKNNILVLSIGSLLASLIGIPPFLGFWGKYLVISSIITSFSANLMIITLSIIIITSMVTAVGYLKLWKIIFIENFYKIVPGQLMPIPLFNSVMLIILNSSFLFLSLFFYFNHFLYYLIDKFLYAIFF